MVGPFGAVPIDRDAEIDALKRAIAFERRARYTNFKGKTSTFAEFMRRTAERLIKRFPQDSRWTTLRGFFRQYPNVDLAARLAIIHRTEEMLFGKVLIIDEPAASPKVHRHFEPQPDLHENHNESRTAAGANRTALTNKGQTKPASGKPVATKAQGADDRPKADYLGSANPKKPVSRNEKPAIVGREMVFPDAFQMTDEANKATKNAKPIAKAGSKADTGIKSPPPSKSPGQENLPSRENLPDEKKRDALGHKSDDPKLVGVQYVKGVGPKMAEMLSRLDIFSADDLLRHYPRQHLDFQHRQQIRNIQPGEDVTIFGTIRSVGAFQSKKGNMSIVSILINDGTGSITVSKFIGGKSNKYLLDRYKNSYPKGAQVMASGRAERDNYGNRLQLRNAEMEILGALAGSDEEMNSLHTGRLVPVYPLTDGLSLRVLRSIIHNALETFAPSLQDLLPEELRQRLDLPDIVSSLWGIHFPENEEQKELARKRLVFDELLLAQLQLALRRHRFQSQTEALSLDPGKGKLIPLFRELLPFKLTGAQERVFGEIARDLASEHPMHRLVQGDVGSGKTVVAAMSALIAIENGFQVAVMAPTEILAEQHYRQFQKWLTPLGLRCALLLGKQGVKERRAIQQDLSSGQINVAIGTHALIQDEVEFQKLGFVVIDEQHRFGVKQRARLKAKGANPELLTMTATPIPRTLALTLHGDLDVSEIDELPPGRKPIKTELIRAGAKKELHARIQEQIVLGRQVYIVFPLIEESETVSAKAATVEFEKLRTQVFPEISIGLMHGKLKPEEKDQVMDQFRKGEFKILVSTTVIEVGVDVPNASVMVIENADRFGLSQLHQLRGRVGRGADQSYCFLVADVKSEMTRQRLGIMCETNDGFVVAEKDLELRGPGEFLGVRQSGMPDLLLADIVKDAKILEEARKIAIELVKEDPQLQKYPALMNSVLSRASSEKSDLLTSG